MCDIVRELSISAFGDPERTDEAFTRSAFVVRLDLRNNRLSANSIEPRCELGEPHMSVYCASKAAIIGMTRALAAELAPDIRCNVICPGGIDTAMAQGLLAGLPPEERAGLLAKLTGRQHLKRFAHPAEIAKTILHLASDESSFITGSVIAADGGHTSW